jgi:hypothetical protein
MMGDLWDVWFRGAKSEQYFVVWGGSLQMVLESLPSLRWMSVHKSIRVAREALVGMQRIG